MKKIITLIAAVASLMSLSSCEALLDTIANDPMFQVRDLYDGQEFRLIRTSTCTYEWYGWNKDYVSLEVKGKEAWITVSLNGNDQPVKTSISAKNPDKADVEPRTEEFEIRPWKLAIFKAVGDKWEEVSTGQLEVGQKYSASMVCREYGVADWKSVASIPYTTLETAKLEWTIDETNLKDVDKHETYTTFVVNKAFESLAISAKLNETSRRISVSAK